MTRRFRYAYFKKLDYFSTECIYSPDAYRGHARAFLKDLEAARPSAIIDIIHSGEAFEVRKEVKATQHVQREFFHGLSMISCACHFLMSFLIDFLQNPARDVDTCRVTRCAKLVRFWRVLNVVWQNLDW